MYTTILLYFLDDITSSQKSTSNNHLLILCKVNFINNETRTLAHMIEVNFTVTGFIFILELLEILIIILFVFNF